MDNDSEQLQVHNPWTPAPKQRHCRPFRVQELPSNEDEGEAGMFIQDVPQRHQLVAISGWPTEAE